MINFFLMYDALVVLLFWYGKVSPNTKQGTQAVFSLSYRQTDFSFKYTTSATNILEVLLRYRLCHFS